MKGSIVALAAAVGMILISGSALAFQGDGEVPPPDDVAKVNIGTCVVLSLKYAVIAEESYKLPANKKPQFDKYVAETEKAYPDDKDWIEAFAHEAWKHRLDMSPIEGGYKIYSGCIKTQIDAASKKKKDLGPEY